MSLAPVLLALTFGLLISALLHFVLVWPAREPVEDDEPAGSAPGPDAGTGAGAAPARPGPRSRKSRRRK